MWANSDQNRATKLGIIGCQGCAGFLLENKPFLSRKKPSEGLTFAWHHLHTNPVTSTPRASREPLILASPNKELLVSQESLSLRKFS